MREVETVRDTLASEEPYQTWVPEEDYEEGELTCQTTYEEKTKSGESSVHTGMSAFFLSIYFWTVKLL